MDKSNKGYEGKTDYGLMVESLSVGYKSDTQDAVTPTDIANTGVSTGERCMYRWEKRERECEALHDQNCDVPLPAHGEDR